jgi:hypothetical protein
MDQQRLIRQSVTSSLVQDTVPPVLAIGSRNGERNWR